MNAPLAFDFQQIQEVHSRWYQLNDCALELFIEGKFSRFFAFQQNSVRDSVLQKLLSMNSKWAKHEKVENLTEKWQNGTLSNFDYLMQLNKGAFINHVVNKEV